MTRVPARATPAPDNDLLGQLDAAAAFNQDHVITDVNFTDSSVSPRPPSRASSPLAPRTLDAYTTADHLGVKRSAAAVI